MKFLWIFSLAMVLTLNFSIFSNSPEGIVEAHLKWSDEKVKVCWGTPKEFNHFHDSELVKTLSKKLNLKNTKKHTLFNQDERKKVQTLIEKHYSKKVTGVHFVGWSDCKIDEDSVRLFGVSKSTIDFSGSLGFMSFFNFGSNYLGRSSIGESTFVGGNLVQKGKRGEQALILKTLNEGTTLHEFGHLAGLRHEHIKPSVMDGRVCELHSNENGSVFSSGEKIGEVAKSFSIGDEFSVMSYCYIKLWKALNKNKTEMTKDKFSDWNSELSKSGIELPSQKYMYLKEGLARYRYFLSPGDIHSLRCLYKDKEDERFCYDGFDPMNNSYIRRIHRKYVKRVLGK